jgi:hypothetical protein
MKMQMVNDLACRPSVIAKDVVAVGVHSRRDGAGDFAQPAPDLTEDLRGTIVNPLEMTAGYDKRMAIAYGADIEKRDDSVVFVDFNGRYLPGRYFAENAIGSTHLCRP